MRGKIGSSGTTYFLTSPVSKTWLREDGGGMAREEG